MSKTKVSMFWSYDLPIIGGTALIVGGVALVMWLLS